MSKIFYQILSDTKALSTMYVEDVEDRSNAPKGCNAMYVEDVGAIKTCHKRYLTDFLEFI